MDEVENIQSTCKSVLFLVMYHLNHHLRIKARGSNYSSCTISEVVVTSKI